METAPKDTGFAPVNQPYANEGTATIDAPATNKAGTELKLEARSIKTASHAWNICKATEQNNRARALRTADVQELHDGAPPRSSANQTEKGKAWQSNASTSWMGGIVGRVAQRFVNANISQIYVTQSSLPDSVFDHKEKTDSLRMGFTRLVRSWEGDTGFINSQCVETVLQGYCYAVFLDPYTWKPTFFKQDRAFVPEMSGQHARELQFFVAKLDYQLHEFIALFTDEEAAKDVGYEIEACVEAANQATVADPREDATTTQFRKFAEMINEGAIGLSFTNTGARIVPVWLLFNREYDGKVSFWMIGRNSGKCLRFSFKLFESMQDAITMFSFEPGNGCIHSSKGLGRKLANLAIMKELFRNGIIDNSRISGLMVIQCESSDSTKFSPTVASPFVILDKSVVIPEQQFNANGETYRIVDQLIDAWAEQAVGAYITQQLNDVGKTEKTATEAQIDARRETESADIQIRRQLDQMAGVRQVMQRRACADDLLDEAWRMHQELTDNPDKDKPEFYEGHQNMDASALRFIVEQFQFGVTKDDFKIWRESPTSPYAHVDDAAIQAGVSQVSVKYAGSPHVDQGELVRRDIEGMVGADLTRKLFIPQADPTLASEGERQQTIESVTMATGKMPIPASPRDNHIIHGMVLQKLLTEVAAPALADVKAPDDVLKVVELNLNHLGEHLKIGSAQEYAKQPAFKELVKFYDGFRKQLEQVVQIRQQAAVAQEAVAERIRTEDTQVPPVAPIEGDPSQSLDGASPAAINLPLAPAA